MHDSIYRSLFVDRWAVEQLQLAFAPGIARELGPDGGDPGGRLPPILTIMIENGERR